LTTLTAVRDALAAHRVTLLPDDGKTRAAVALVIREAPRDVELLFIERAKRDDDPWSGHLAFPGGRAEERDRTVRDTAERETLEEIGLDLASAACLGRLDDITGTMAPVVLSGFVYGIEKPGALRLSPEVQDAFWVPLDELLNGDRHTRYRRRHQGAERMYPAIDLLGPGRPILWGLTYRFVWQFLKLLGHEIPAPSPGR